MKTIGTALATHLAGQVLTMCSLFEIVRRDETVLRFADLDQDVVFEGQTYLAAHSYSRSAIQSTSGLSVDNLDVEAVLDSSAIAEADLLAGKYDGARIRLVQINWLAPEQGALKERKGTLGNVVLRRGQFGAELRGLTQALTRSVVQITSPSCRTDYGSAECGADLTAETFPATVTSVDDRHVFRASALTQATDYFRHGRVTWLTGDNAGLSMEIKGSSSDGGIECWLPAPYAFQVGDTLNAVRGCGKSLDDCVARNRVASFRGEPYMPGQDFLNQYPSSRAPTGEL
jgi:uncharacterized phage protein (TIGR02218 family)